MITLVWTDLVASTEMKQHLPGRDIGERNQFYLDHILCPHRDRVGTSVLDCGGKVISTEGDSFFLMFPTVTAALQWAVDLQRNHVEQPIETPLGFLQVRMGIHTGSPLQIDGDYIGQEVDYLTRIASLAQGSQILLSEVTAVLAKNAGFRDFQIIAYGDRPLRGIGTVPIFEVLWHPGGASNRLADPTPLRGRQLWRSRQLREMVLISLCCTAVVLGLRGMGVFHAPELWGFDHLVRLRPAEKPDPRLLIVTVTNQDLKQQSQDNRRSAISDAQLLKLLTQLDQLGASVIGLDVYRDFPVKAQFPQLAELLRTDSRVIAICKSQDTQEDPTGVAPPTEVPSSRIGFSDFIEDRDGILRRQLLFMTPEPLSPCPAYYAFGTQVALRYLAEQGITPSFTQNADLKLGKTVFKRFTFGPGQDAHTEGGHQMLLNFRALPSGSKIAPQVSLQDVLNHKVSPEWVKNRIVLIGVHASSSSDYWATPYGASGAQKMPGVMVQAHMISHLLSAVLDQRPIFWQLSGGLESLWIGLWSTLGAVGLLGVRVVARLGGSFLRWILGGMAIAMVSLGLVCWLALIQGLWLPGMSAYAAFLMALGWGAYRISKNRK